MIFRCRNSLFLPSIKDSWTVPYMDICIHFSLHLSLLLRLSLQCEWVSSLFHYFFNIFSCFPAWLWNCCVVVVVALYCWWWVAVFSPLDRVSFSEFFRTFFSTLLQVFGRERSQLCTYRFSNGRHLPHSTNSSTKSLEQRLTTVIYSGIQIVFQ